MATIYLHRPLRGCVGCSFGFFGYPQLVARPGHHATNSKDDDADSEPNVSEPPCHHVRVSNACAGWNVEAFPRLLGRDSEVLQGNVEAHVAIPYRSPHLSLYGVDLLDVVVELGLGEGPGEEVGVDSWVGG